MSTKDKRLKTLREKIDDIDDQILALLNKRISCAQEIGKIKHTARGRFHVLEREEAIYNRLLSNNTGPLPSDAVRPIFREIISASLSLEKVLNIACLGPEGTFSHSAALQQFGQSARYVTTRTVPDIFDEVERGRADYGVVPVENSTEGVVNLALDMFIDSPLRICAEVMLEISHCLLTMSERLDAIRLVYSHPQALAQCLSWIRKNVPQAEIKETSSTTMAAKLARDDACTAAIASSFAARLYELPVLRSKIEDNANNCTRFWVIGKTSPGRTGNDKTSLMFSIKDGAGALHTALLPFAKNGINLTKIESRPFRKQAWQYIFFIDLEGHSEDSDVHKAIDELATMSNFIKVLGSYPHGTTNV